MPRDTSTSNNGIERALYLLKTLSAERKRDGPMPDKIFMLTKQLYYGCICSVYESVIANGSLNHHCIWTQELDPACSFPTSELIHLLILR